MDSLYLSCITFKVSLIMRCFSSFRICKNVFLILPYFADIILTLYSIIAPFFMFMKILWKKEHLLFWSKCSIFHNIFKGIQNLT